MDLLILPDINTIPDLEIEEKQYKNMYIGDISVEMIDYINSNK